MLFFLAFSTPCPSVYPDTPITTTCAILAKGKVIIHRPDAAFISRAADVRLQRHRRDVTSRLVSRHRVARTIALRVYVYYIRDLSLSLSSLFMENDESPYFISRLIHRRIQLAIRIRCSFFFFYKYIVKHRTLLQNTHWQYHFIYRMRLDETFMKPYFPEKIRGKSYFEKISENILKDLLL